MDHTARTQDGRDPKFQSASAQQMRSDRRDPVKLLFAAEQRIESRFAAISCIAMNDSAFGRFIERGNQAPNLFDVGLGRAARFFLK